MCGSVRFHLLLCDTFTWNWDAFIEFHFSWYYLLRVRLKTINFTLKTIENQIKYQFQVEAKNSIGFFHKSIISWLTFFYCFRRSYFFCSCFIYLFFVIFFSISFSCEKWNDNKIVLHALDPQISEINVILISYALRRATQSDALV